MVYGREYGGRVLSFEPSGALWEATLVMRDRETDSWWSIVTGDAVGGDLKGQKLLELPVGEKVRWGEWRERYPDTQVLSVDGREHDPRNPYAEYFNSDRTFQHLEAKDPRLPAKEPIFAFDLDDGRYAVPHSAIEDGASIVIGNNEIFLFRRTGADVFESTRAYIVTHSASPKKTRIKKQNGVWVDSKSGAEFSPLSGFPGDPENVAKLVGFDTFWYSFANIVSGAVILNGVSPGSPILEIQ